MRVIGSLIVTLLLWLVRLIIGNWVNADQATGRIMHFPSKTVFNKVITNYSQGFQFIWNEIPVLVTFENDWEKTKEILQDIINRHAGELDTSVEEQFRHATRRFMIDYKTMLTPTVYTHVEDSVILLTLRYLCDYRSRRTSEHNIWEDILNAFAQESDIEFAYSTQRFCNDWVERREQGAPQN